MVLIVMYGAFFMCLFGL